MAMRPGLTAEESLVHATVGAETFARGTEYVASGRVGAITWAGRGNVARAQVTGQRRRAYLTTVSVHRDGARLVAVSGACTCSVSVNCKHVAAVLLRVVTGDDAGVAQVRHGAGAPGTAGVVGWQATLEGLSARVGIPEPTAAAVALQFEVRAEPGRSLSSVVLRPVIPGRNGGWVRTGVGWNNLTALRYGGDAAAHGYRLLSELVTAAAPGDHYSRYQYSYREPRITLEAIASRRVWDLFDELRAAGVPLVGAGRSAAEVRLHERTAHLTVDLRENGVEVTIAPRLVLADDLLPHEHALLVGDPLHGLAWSEGGRLNLARIAAMPGVDARAMLHEPALTVPTKERDVLLAQYVPELQRLTPVRSTDGSVVILEPEPPLLTLRVEHLEGHRLDVAWDWTYPLRGAQRREPLWPSTPATRGRAGEVERHILDVVEPLASALPELFDGDHLAPDRQLVGMSTVVFLRDVLPALEGVDSVAVSVIGEPVEYHEVHAAPSVEFVGSAEERDWFDLRVEVSVAGERVAFVTLFEALAGEQQYLILPSGAFFALDRPEFAQLLALIVESRELLDAPPGTVRVGRLQAGVWEDLERMGVISAQADAWRALARDLARVDRVAEHPVPSGLQAELRPYQVDGFHWLAFLYEHDLGGVLADEMGLGKTLQALALMCHVREKGLHDAPFLVVAPTSVVHNWAAEAARFAPGLAVRTVVETGRRRGVPLAQVAAEADVVITSYTLFRLEHDQYAELEWAGLLLDEAQFVKNHQSVGHACAKTLDVGFKLAITGTPLENNLMELWSLLSITAPGLFPHPRRFEQYYRVPVERDHDVDRLEQLRTRVRPLMLRRTKQAVITDLPDKQEQVLELDLNPRHRKVYQTLLQRERQKVLGLLGDVEKNRFAIFRSLTLLRQACLDAGLVDDAYAGVPSTKLDVLLDHLVEVVSEGHTAVVFSQFTRFLALARARLDAAGIPYSYLDGRTKRRAEVVQRFKDGQTPVFLVSLKAGGVGLNLTEADYCFLLDPWWNPATEAQAVDRLHRIGQRRTVMVYRLVARETIEEKVMALKAGKASLFDSVLDAKGVVSGKLTAADIRGLIS